MEIKSNEIANLIKKQIRNYAHKIESNDVGRSSASATESRRCTASTRRCFQNCWNFRTECTEW